jgi:hypothetical protein
LVREIVALLKERVVLECYQWILLDYLEVSLEGLEGVVL